MTNFSVFPAIAYLTPEVFRNRFCQNSQLIGHNVLWKKDLPKIRLFPFLFVFYRNPCTREDGETVGVLLTLSGLLLPSLPAFPHHPPSPLFPAFPPFLPSLTTHPPPFSTGAIAEALKG